MKIGIVGCGYVGLSIAVNMSQKGFNCLCYDVDKTKIDKLNNGVLPFYEKDLQNIFDNYKENISFVSDSKIIAQDCKVIYFAVNTPSDKNGRCDISYLKNAILTINNFCDKERIFIIKSTCEVGTTEYIDSIVSNKVKVVFSPEFLAQGQMIKDTMYPQRIVFGLKTPQKNLKQNILSLYKLEQKNNIPIIFTDYRTAELSKYACNSFLALKISFINLISQLCDKLGADIKTVEEIMKLDYRIGKKYLDAGMGFGGSCFHKDLSALGVLYDVNGLQHSLINEVLNINEQQINYCLKKITDFATNKDILVLGTTFKKNTSDTTNSPSASLIKKLLQKDYNIYVYDVVNVDYNKIGIADKVTKITNFEQAVNKFENIVLGSDWEEFKALQKMKFKSHKNIFDLKQTLDTNKIKNCSVYYVGQPNY